MTAGIRRSLDYAVVFVAYVATARFGLSFDALGGHRDDGLAADRDRAGGARPAGNAALAGGRRWRRSSSTSRPASRSGARRSSPRATRWRRSWARPCCGGSRSTRGSDGCVTFCCWSGWAALGSTLISATFGVAAAALAQSAARRELPGLLGRVVGRRRDGRRADRPADLRLGVADAVVTAPAPLAGVRRCWSPRSRWSSAMVFRRPHGRARHRAGPRDVRAHAAADLGGASVRAAGRRRPRCCSSPSSPCPRPPRRAATSRHGRRTNAC